MNTLCIKLHSLLIPPQKYRKKTVNERVIFKRSTQSKTIFDCVCVFYIVNRGEWTLQKSKHWERWQPFVWKVLSLNGRNCGFMMSSCQNLALRKRNFYQFSLPVNLSTVKPLWEMKKQSHRLTKCVAVIEKLPHLFQLLKYLGTAAVKKRLLHCIALQPQISLFRQSIVRWSKIIIWLANFITDNIVCWRIDSPFPLYINSLSLPSEYSSFSLNKIRSLTYANEENATILTKKTTYTQSFLLGKLYRE